MILRYLLCVSIVVVSRFEFSEKTSGIVESMKTTVERMTTAIEVKAYSWNENSTHYSVMMTVYQ